MNAPGNPNTAVIYIDVDGTLAPVNLEPPRAATGWLGDWSEATIDQQKVRWSHELVNSLNDLFGSDLAGGSSFVPVWVTGWEAAAATLLSPRIGLDGAEWPVLRGVADDRSDAWWKLAAIKQDIIDRAPSKAVWLDDDIRLSDEAVAWVRGSWAADHGTQLLAISPSSLHGLSVADVAELRAFLDS